MWLASTVRSAISADFTSIVSTAPLIAPPASRAASFVSAAASRAAGSALSSALSAAAAALSAFSRASCSTPAAVFEQAARDRLLSNAIARNPFFKLITGPPAGHTPDNELLVQKACRVFRSPVGRPRRRRTGIRDPECDQWKHLANFRLQCRLVDHDGFCAAVTHLSR